jgi:hypothetical protein
MANEYDITRGMTVILYNDVPERNEVEYWGLEEIFRLAIAPPRRGNTYGLVVKLSLNLREIMTEDLKHHLETYTPFSFAKSISQHTAIELMVDCVSACVQDLNQYLQHMPNEVLSSYNYKMPEPQAIKEELRKLFHLGEEN